MIEIGEHNVKCNKPDREGKYRTVSFHLYVESKNKVNLIETESKKKKKIVTRMW